MYSKLAVETSANGTLSPGGGRGGPGGGGGGGGEPAPPTETAVNVMLPPSALGHAEASCNPKSTMSVDPAAAVVASGTASVPRPAAGPRTCLPPSQFLAPSRTSAVSHV